MTTADRTPVRIGVIERVFDPIERLFDVPPVTLSEHPFERRISTLDHRHH